MTKFTFVDAKGKTAVQRIKEIQAAATITQGDKLMYGQTGRSLIIARTLKGVDVNGSAFKGYSTKTPYYYYPGRAGISDSARRGLSTKLLNKITLGKTRRKKLVARTTVGLRFASYAAFKLALGRSNVDLTGPRAPHMLQAIIVRAGGREIASGSANIRPDELVASQPFGQVELLISGEFAGRAIGHNEGTKNLPKRRFFGLNKTEVSGIITLMAARINSRIAKGRA